MSILASVSMPAFLALASGQNVTRSAYDLAGYLEYARAEAIARQTYVWVGIQTVDTGSAYEVRVGAAYSKDGSGANLASSNLAPLAKMLVIPQAQLKSLADLDDKIREQCGVTTVSLAKNEQGVENMTVGNQDFARASGARSLTFTPGGEAVLNGSVAAFDGFDPWIDLGLQETKGKQRRAGADQAALVLAGSHGGVRILRIQ
jgi:hypothetical protein